MIAAAAILCGRLLVGEGCEVIIGPLALRARRRCDPDLRASSAKWSKFADLHDDIISQREGEFCRPAFARLALLRSRRL